MKKEITTYNKTFDYEDMKIAMVVQEFFDYNQALFLDNGFEDYEDFIELCVEIRQAWDELNIETCEREEYAYVQYFAEHYLQNKFLGGEE